MLHVMHSDGDDDDGDDNIAGSPKLFLVALVVELVSIASVACCRSSGSRSRSSNRNGSRTWQDQDQGW